MCSDEIIRDSKQIAIEFNRYFHSVFSDPSVCANSNDNCIKVDPEFITFEGVFSMLLNIKSKSSCGPDNILNVFLRRYAESLARFLVVFSLVLIARHCPERLAHRPGGPSV